MSKSCMIEWRPVKGYESLYEVSTDGQVRTVERHIVRCTGATLPIKQKIKLPRVGKNGYLTIALVKHNKTNNTYLHRIIAQAFIPAPTGCNVVNHLNGIKIDNRIENLEWTTSGENNAHAIRNRLRRPAHAVLTEKQAIQIKEMRQQGLTIKSIAKMLSISNYTVGEYLRGKSYRWMKV